MAEFDLVKILEESGASKSGHFLLASGKHSDKYVEKFDLLRQPILVEQACNEFARRVTDLDVDVVAGPTTGGILLAFEVARQLGVKAAYAERESDGSSAREFKRGTTFESGSRVLVIDDILTTGGSVRETLAALEDQPVEVVAVAVLVDRSGGTAEFGVPLVSLAELNIATWDADECPLCASGIDLTKPGTTTVITAGNSGHGTT